MRVLTKLSTAGLALALIAPAVLLAALAAPASPARAAPAGSGSCYPVNFTWICVYSGGGGGGSGTSSITCTFVKAPPAMLKRAGTGPPAPGYRWDIMTCPGVHGGHLVQVSLTTGIPAISSFGLLKIGIGALSVPTLAAATAPPRGRNGLVGLPEWFWVPRGQWHPVSLTVSAGPVWAKATAVPTELSYVPGGGMGSVSCTGPGTAFDPAKTAAQQHTGCSYTYTEPSSRQPGSAYQAGLFVTWTVSWTGSGGAGGLITNRYTTGNAFSVRVAQAEALVTTP